LSIAYRKNVPAHLHTKNEIVDVIEAEVLRPKYKGVLADDVIVGVLKEKIITIDDTSVRCNYFLEAENKPFNIVNGSVVDDAEASGGKAAMLQMSYGDPVYKNFLESDEIPVASGDFYLLFNLKMKKYNGTLTYGQINIAIQQNGEILATLTVPEDDFPEAGKYHIFAVRIHTLENWNNIKIFVTAYFLENEDEPDAYIEYYMDFAAVVYGGIPKSSADITVVESSTGISIPSQTTGISVPNETTGISVPSPPGQSCASATTVGFLQTTVPLEQWTTVRSITVPNEDHEILFVHASGVCSSSTGFAAPRVRIKNATDNEYYPAEDYSKCPEVVVDPNFNILLTIPKNVAGDTLELQFYHEYGTESIDVYVSMAVWGHSPHYHVPDDPSHTHPPDDPSHTHPPDDPSHQHATDDPKHEH